MDNSLPDKNTENRTVSTIGASDQEIILPDTDDESTQPVYRYVTMTNNQEIAPDRVHLESPEVGLGDVVEIEIAGGKKDYFSVDHLDEDEITTVYLVRARNSLGKSLLLLAILGVSWYIIDFLLQQLF